MNVDEQLSKLRFEMVSASQVLPHQDTEPMEIMAFESAVCATVIRRAGVAFPSFEGLT